MTSSITYWNRLEPRPRAADLSEALAARAYDPAWLLARQWQLGEFQGEDAGAPAFLRLMQSVSPLTAWGVDGEALQSLDRKAPLEASVTAESPSTVDLSRAVELGQTLERWLTEAGVADLHQVFREAYPIAVLPEEEPRATRLRALWRGRAIDGLAVWAATQQPVPPPPPGVDLTPAPVPGVPWTVPAMLRDQAGTAIGNLLGWIEGMFGAPGDGGPPGWQPETLTATPRVYGVNPDANPVAFTVTPDHRGDIDWFAFDGHADVPGGIPSATVLEQTVAVIPGPVRFRGMPNERFWDFEDARYAIDAIRPGIGTDQVAKLLPKAEDFGFENELAAFGLSGSQNARPLLRRPKAGLIGKFAGYKGRSGIYELVLVDEAMRRLIHDGAAEADLEKMARGRTPSIAQDGWLKCLAGTTSTEEVLRVVREE